MAFSANVTEGAHLYIFFFIKHMETPHLVLHRGHFCDKETLCHLQISE